MNSLLSIIVPCYNEQDSIPLFFNAIRELEMQFKDICLEVLFINDGSTDETLSILRQLRLQDSRVRYISFSRNFGKEAGIYAGLQAAKGDYVVLMDADLQHPPEMIPLMYHAIVNEGYDCAAARRTTRAGEPKIRSFFSRCFYKIIHKISRSDMVDGATDFRMMTRQVVNAILAMRESNRFTKGIFGWVGFSTKWLPYENVERVAGKTAWSFWGLFKYSLEGIISFSTAPLALASLLGILSCTVAVIVGIGIAVKTLIWGDPVAGYPTLACLILLLGGVQLLVIGILGQYLSRIYLETKKRPIYIVKETEKDYDTQSI